MLDTEFIAAKRKDSKRLMIVLHGMGDSAKGSRWLPMELDLPWMNYLLVNAPDPYFVGYSWFKFPGDSRPGVARSYPLLVELLDAQRAAGFPSEETILFGFSQGCLMTWVTGVCYPHRLAGCVGISGFLPSPEELLARQSPVAKQQRFLITHGTYDQLLSIEEACEQVRFMQSAGMQVEWREFPKPHGFAGEPEFAEIRKFVRACYPGLG